jgi:ketosteroid isomerase-like protein
MTKFPRFPILPAAALPFAMLLAACGATASRPSRDEAAREVEAAERAFAQTMARRDHAAFTRFLADEAIFFGDSGPLRGKAAVAQGWAPFFTGAAAPFSWEPERVEVLESGTLALSTGPVRTPDGKIVGVFNSVWRREAPGTWRVVFDKGGEVCDGGKRGGGG